MLCYWSEAVDDVLLEAMFVGLCYWSEAVDDVLLKALFYGYLMGVGTFVMFCWRHCF